MAESGRPRPAHRRVGPVVLVASGGAVGSLLRYAVALVLYPDSTWPWATWTVNVVGAFCLGLLLEVLLHSGGPEPTGERLRLAIGTGVLGGFTTYSSLAGESERLLASTGPRALVYPVGSVLAGLLAAWAGVCVARWATRRQVAARSARERRVGVVTDESTGQG